MTGAKPPKHGCLLFTLALIIVILLAMPRLLNFLKPTSAAKDHRVLRTQSFMRTMATALQTYHLDYQTYPLSEPLAPALTTPIAYVNEIYTDSTAPKTSPPLQIRYYGSKDSFLLYAHGPDRDIDIQPTDEFLHPDDHTPLIPYTFDATNGAKSNGDLWRKGNPDEY